MSLSISSSLSLESSNAYSQPAAVQKPQPVTTAPSDTVKISESQQVVQLYQQGQQVSQIASTLSLPLETVNSYLGIVSNQ